MDGTSYFPSRPEMEANLVAFAERAGVEVRYGCRWTATRTVSTGGRRPVRGRDDRRRLSLPRARRRGRRRRAVHAAGRRAWSTRTTTPTSGRSRPTPDQRVLIIGKQNSGLRAGERAAAVGSPADRRVAVEGPPVGRHARRWSGSGRATSSRSRTTSWAAASASSMPPSTGSSVVRDGRLTVHLRRTDGGGDLAVEVDDVISATGFVTPLLDLPELGVQTFGASRLPVQTPWWESATRPGHLLRGHHRPGRQGAPEARRPGELRGGPRRPLQRLGARRPRIARRVVRDRAGAAAPRVRRRSPGSSPPSWPRRPSSSTSAATSPGS